MSKRWQSWTSECTHPKHRKEGTLGFATLRCLEKSKTQCSQVVGLMAISHGTIRKKSPTKQIQPGTLWPSMYKWRCFNCMIPNLYMKHGWKSPNKTLSEVTTRKSPSPTFFEARVQQLDPWVAMTQYVPGSINSLVTQPFPIRSMGLVYLPTCTIQIKHVPYKSTIHVGKYTIVPWIRNGFWTITWKTLTKFFLHEILCIGNKNTRPKA